MKFEAKHVVPSLRYKDANGAIDWFCNCLGFEKKLVVPTEDNKIAHAQLALGDIMIMLSSVIDTPFGKHMISPIDIDGKNTQSSYIIMHDVEAHYELAKKTGVQMLLDFKKEEYGGAGYTCIDPEGNLWTFGSYDPWAPQ